MISHTHVGVNDFDRAFRFYSTLMKVSGLRLRFEERTQEWARLAAS